MVPLQVGLPSGSGPVILVLFFAIAALLLTYWLYTDAETRGDDDAALWGVVAGLASFFGSPIAGLLVVAVYLWQRDQ